MKLKTTDKKHILNVKNLYLTKEKMHLNINV